MRYLYIFAFLTDMMKRKLYVSFNIFSIKYIKIKINLGFRKILFKKNTNRKN